MSDEDNEPIRVSIFLKSGQEFTLDCMEFEVSRNYAGEPVKIRWVLVKNPPTRILYLDPGNISAITYSYINDPKSTPCPVGFGKDTR